jgi:hypothetical protein
MIRWCRERSGYVIGDFGCGEAKLAEALSDRHTVHSFDHVTVNDDVIACDMAHVPLDDPPTADSTWRSSRSPSWARISPITYAKCIAC